MAGIMDLLQELFGGQAQAAPVGGNLPFQPRPEQFGPPMPAQGPPIPANFRMPDAAPVGFQDPFGADMSQAPVGPPGPAVAPGFWNALGNMSRNFSGNAAAPPAPAQAAAPAFRLPTMGQSSTQTTTISPTGDIIKPPNPIDSYLPKMMGAESGSKMVPNAAGASSAFGPAQFTNGTWIDTVKESDPATYKALGGDESKILALRTNPDYHNQMARAFTAKNAEVLGQKGLPVNDATLYTMHFFGRGDGPKVLAAADNTPLSSVVDKASIAANPHLAGMTVGQAKAWAANTIGGSTSQNAFQASSANNMPGVPGLVAPQLPKPGLMQPHVGLSPEAYDRFNALRVIMPPPLETSDRITNVLAQMAAGARGAKNVADVMLGAGAGAGAGAAANVARDRGELEKGSERSQRLMEMLAGVGVDQAKAAQQGANFQVDAANVNTANLNQVQTKQAELDAATKNKLAEIGFNLDKEKWQMGLPQTQVDQHGNWHTVTRFPDGTTKIITQRSQDMEEMAKKAREAETVFGKGSPMASTLKYQALESAGGEAAVKREVLSDLVAGNHVESVLGSAEYKKQNAEAEKGIDPSLRGKIEEFDKERKRRLVDLLVAKNIPDSVYVPYMARLGNYGAVRLMPKAQ